MKLTEGNTMGSMCPNRIVGGKRPIKPPPSLMKKHASKKEMKSYRKRAETALKTFIEFLSHKDKIKTAEDLVSGLLYTHISGIPGCTYECILWTGLSKRSAEMIGEPYDYDAQINVQMGPAEKNGVYVLIAKHKPGELLSDLGSWKFEN